MNVTWHLLTLMLAVVLIASCDTVEQVTGKDDGRSNKGNSQDLKTQSATKKPTPKKNDDDDDDDDDEKEEVDDDDDDSTKLSCDDIWSKGLTHAQTGLIWRKLREYPVYPQLQASKGAPISHLPYYYAECADKLGEGWRNATGQDLFLAYKAGFFKPNSQNNKCAAPVKVYPAPYSGNRLWCPPNAFCAPPLPPSAVSDWLFCVKDAAAKSCDRCATGEAFIGEQCVDKEEFIACTASYQPVCTCDRVTHSNSCYARLSGYKSWTEGACTDGGPIY